MTGLDRLSTSSTRATDFSRPTSKGATAPGEREALRMGSKGSSAPNWTTSSSGGRGGVGGAFLSDMQMTSEVTWNGDETLFPGYAPDARIAWFREQRRT